MTAVSKNHFRVLTVAGSDSGGGAGIQADLKTFSALGCYGMSAITALTAQNTVHVRSILAVSREFLRDQLDAVLSDIGADAVKVGMLHSPEIIAEVGERLRFYGVRNIVVDPVMVAKSGDRLLQQEAVDALMSTLVPIADVLTPNLPEAETLLGTTIRNAEEMESAALQLLDLGCRVVMLKGGHAIGPFCDDFVCPSQPTGSQGLAPQWLRGPRTETRNTHGTGCTLSAAIAALLARGLPVLDALKDAKSYLTGAIEAGADFRLGSGHGPVQHFYRFWDSDARRTSI